MPLVAPLHGFRTNTDSMVILHECPELHFASTEGA